MKRGGILHAELAGALGRLGHTDLIVIGDCGLPRPAGVPVIDLALVFGVPTFEQVLCGVLGEIVVEQAVLADEAAEVACRPFPCAPCRRIATCGDRDCMRALTVDEVMQAVRKVADRKATPAVL